MTIYDLKKSFQNILRPFTNKLAKNGVTANQVTISALLISCACGSFVYFSNGSALSLLLVPVVLFIRMALNAIDGMLAREHDMASNLGALLNEFGDVISDCALYLPFAAIHDMPPSLVVIIVLLAVLSEMAGVVAIQIGAGRRYDGPMGKSDRAFAFSCLALLLASGYARKALTDSILWVMALLLLITIFNRSRHALAEAVAKDKITF